MYNNKDRRRKYRPNANGRFYHRRNDGKGRRNNSAGFFSNGQIRPNIFKGGQNIQQLIEKYNNLAKEALTSGDNILSESYLQHADHFSRLVVDNNNNRATQHSNQVNELISKSETTASQDKNIQLENNLDKKTDKEVK